MSENKKQRAFSGELIYYLFCAFTGIVIGLIVWLFLRAMNLGIELVWQVIPENFTALGRYYPLVMCGVGGLLLGAYLMLTKAEPDELETIIYKVKKNKFYPYDKVFLLCISALLPLIFGASVGPEAGLTGIIVGLCYWAGSHMKSLNGKIPNLLEVGISATLSAVFFAPLFGLVVPEEGERSVADETALSKKKKYASNIIAVLFTVGTIYLLNTLFNITSGFPRIGDYSITNTERLWGIALVLLGALLGIIYMLFEKLTDVVFGWLKGKAPIIISTTLGGLILGIFGTYFPLTMFSGEESITQLQADYLTYTPWLLITVGLLKLLLTNVCIKSGLKGGHFFPVIFCGISIGCGVAMLTGLDMAFCEAVVTAALLGTTMKKPLAVTMLLLLCFDVRIIPWILLAAFIGSIIPIGKKKEVKQ